MPDYLGVDAVAHGVQVGGMGFDNAPYLQPAWNYATSIGAPLLLPATGNSFIYSSPLTKPPVTGSYNGGRAPLVGQGLGCTALVIPTVGATAAITIHDSVGAGLSGYDVMRDLFLWGAPPPTPTLTQPAPYSGRGIRIAQLNEFAFRNVGIGFYAEGVSGIDCQNILWESCRFLWNGTHVHGLAQEGGVPAQFCTPDRWTFVDTIAANSVTGGFVFENPASLSFIRGDFENNNTSAAGHGRGVIEVIGGTKDGIRTLIIDGAGFGDNGGYDIAIHAQDASPIHALIRAELSRNMPAGAPNCTTHNVLIDNGGTGRTVIDLSGCTFSWMAAGSPPAGYEFLSVLNPSNPQTTILGYPGYAASVATIF